MKFFSQIYESWREIQYEKYEVIFKELEGMDVKIDGRSVVDVGSASGFLLDFMKKAGITPKIYVGVDPDPTSIFKLTSKLRGIARGEMLPFKNEAFDIMFCIDVLHLLNGALDTSVVKCGGIVVVSLPERFEKRMYDFMKSARKHGIKKDRLITIEGREREKVAILRKLC